MFSWMSSRRFCPIFLSYLRVKLMSSISSCFSSICLLIFSTSPSAILILAFSSKFLRSNWFCRVLACKSRAETFASIASCEACSNVRLCFLINSRRSEYSLVLFIKSPNLSLVFTVASAEAIAKALFLSFNISRITSCFTPAAVSLLNASTCIFVSEILSLSLVILSW